jgi:phosphoribosylformylglycinamidine cyclo-ligase
MDYKDSGVDIAAGNELVNRIKPLAKATRLNGVLSSIGGFGAMYELPLDKYKNPVIVTGTDGVGTKLKLAFETGIHNTIGIDLVAMSVNDIIVQGAEPILFLDYFATGKLNVDIAEQVIEGISIGCIMSGASLVGGETAEMPGMYPDGEYDLAGFCIGLVEKSNILDGSKIKVGDSIIGIESSGLHSNGYSLARKIVNDTNTSLDMPFDGSSLGKKLLTPTKIYTGAVLPVIDKINGLAHITGGGITENLPRVLPTGLCANIVMNGWGGFPRLFKWLQDNGNVSQEEMLKTFNCGIGMIAIVDPDNVSEVMVNVNQSGHKAHVIGKIAAHDQNNKVNYF